MTAGVLYGIAFLTVKFINGFVYLWKPACDTCDERSPECLAKENCEKFEEHSTFRGLFLCAVVIAALIGWFCFFRGTGK